MNRMELGNRLMKEGVGGEEMGKGRKKERKKGGLDVVGWKWMDGLGKTHRMQRNIVSLSIDAASLCAATLRYFPLYHRAYCISL